MTTAVGRDFADVFARELDRLASELQAYADEADLWETMGSQKNPPGTLALHLVGNLMCYVGDGLGRTGYVRDREAEFADRNVPREELLRRVVECRETVTEVLSSMPDEAFEAVYGGETPTRMQGIGTRAFLVHLTWHLGWHLGHIYYHRLAIGPDVT